MPLATTVRSAIENLSPEARLRVYVLDGGLEERTKERVIRSWPAGRFEISWVRVDASSLGDPRTMRGSIACYFRILMPRVLPSSLHQAIYLDSDLLIRSDLTRLWSHDISGNLCLAVQDVGAPFIDSTQAIKNFRDCAPYISYKQPIPNFRALGLDPKAPYLNSGVLLIDLDGWRREDITSRLIECLTMNAQYVHLWDQYALNVVLVNRWGNLDRRWNQGHYIYKFPCWELSPYDKETFDQQLNDPHIVHFTSAHKPWRASCRHPLRQDFIDCLQRTDWAGWRLPRLEILAESLKTQERRIRRGRRWLQNYAWNLLSGDRKRSAA
jgi:lipopolysaccharide biosynthesis glycosyltransferase